MLARSAASSYLPPFHMQPALTRLSIIEFAALIGRSDEVGGSAIEGLREREDRFLYVENLKALRMRGYLLQGIGITMTQGDAKSAKGGRSGLICFHNIRIRSKSLSHSNPTSLS